MIDILGVIGFAISGVVLAERGRYNLFAAMLLAACPAVGGGVIRDLLVGRYPLGLLESPVYLLATIGTVLVGFAVSRFAHWSRDRAHPEDAAVVQGSSEREVRQVTEPRLAPVQVFDAFGFSAAAVVGVIVALEKDCNPLWLWGPVLAGVPTLGGALREVFGSNLHISRLEGAFYPEVSVVWGLGLSLYLSWYARQVVYRPSGILLAVVIALAGSFFTRLIALYFGLKMPRFGRTGDAR